MATFLDRKKALIAWVDDLINKRALLDIPGLYEGVYSTIDKDEQAEYIESASEAVITIKVSGTKYEGRPARIEGIKKGQGVKLARDKQNAYDSNCIEILNAQNESLGNLPGELATVLSPLLDAGEANIIDSKVAIVTPPSQLKDKRKAPILYVSFKVKLNKATNAGNVKCIVCQIGGDQTRMWAQKIRVLYCSISAEDAKLMFELYNRQMKEYTDEATDCSYAGLDNLVAEIEFAREKMRAEMDPSVDYSLEGENILNKDKARYASIMKNIHSDEDSFDPWLKNAFENYVVDEKTYYWLDETHVGRSVWDRENECGFNHWYEVMELFEGNKLPVDLDDEDVVSVFGTKKFAALADLSYGC